jgi:hypothetical protein
LLGDGITAARKIQEVAQRVGSSNSIWGRFSVALAFADRTAYRTLMPDLTKLVFTHTGVHCFRHLHCSWLVSCVHCMCCAVVLSSQAVWHPCSLMHAFMCFNSQTGAPG